MTDNVSGSLCLVLALKETARSPFLALDEFDVFMDERNRQLSLQILTKVCSGAACQSERAVHVDTHIYIHTHTRPRARA